MKKLLLIILYLKIEFIEKVPQDSEMFIEGGKCYNHQAKEIGTCVEITDEQYWQDTLRSMHQNSSNIRNTPEMQGFFSRLKALIHRDKNKDETNER